MTPAVAVFVDRGAAGPAEILRAARGLCEVVLLYRGDREYAASIRPVLRALGAVDLAGRSDAEIVAAVRRVRPAGVTTFSEYCVGVCGMVADELSLPGNPGESTARLVDKVRQRTALCAAGVPGARWARLNLDGDP